VKSRTLAVLGACAALLAALALPAALPRAFADTPDAATAQLGPQELMQQVSKRMFDALDANRAAIKKDPDKVFPLVDTILLPHFDTDYAAQLVLAQYWRTATPDQKKRFIDALYHALLHTYGGALADFTADRLKILPFRGDPGAAVATVRTEVTRSGGQVVPVDYRLRKTDTGWKAFDVVIEGISYVRNYRTDLGAEAGDKGLEAVITRLERDGLDLDKSAAKPAAAH
jgi:phospholipid transport system substrate-binding protein